MSMSIPIFFEPVIHTNPQTGEEHLIVDGGMLSNFPVWLFDCEGQEPRWPTFGLLLVEPDPKVAIGHRLAGQDFGAKLGSLVDYAKSLAVTMMEAHDRLYVDKATYARTIPIPTLGVGTTEFEIPRERADGSTSQAIRLPATSSTGGTSPPTCGSSGVARNTRAVLTWSMRWPAQLRLERAQGQSAFSRVSSWVLAAGPPRYCPTPPSVRSTRWHGTRIGRGLVASADPAARTALGLPAATATCRYEEVWP